MTDSSREVIEQEIERIVHRLGTMPLKRIDAQVQQTVSDAAQRIVDLTPDPQRPEGVRIPDVGALALGPQLAVVVADYLECTTAAPEDAAVAKIVTDIRRSLP